MKMLFVLLILASVAQAGRIEIFLSSTVDSLQSFQGDTWFTPQKCVRLRGTTSTEGVRITAFKGCHDDKRQYNHPDLGELSEQLSFVYDRFGHYWISTLKTDGWFFKGLASPSLDDAFTANASRDFRSPFGYQRLTSFNCQNPLLTFDTEGIGEIRTSAYAPRTTCSLNLSPPKQPPVAWLATDYIISQDVRIQWKQWQRLEENDRGEIVHSRL